MEFVQIIEFTTTRIDEVEALVDEWRAKTQGTRNARRSTLTRDCGKPSTYLNIVEFPSYEEAMANSALPETAALAKGIAELCDGPPAFRDLDVYRAYRD
ncbi:MAG TPA: hypothetical protein VMU76_09710 [Acidimicrobiales bacterium]|nr:hypothetical protein [Acidimicrobiales bacterium]